MSNRPLVNMRIMIIWICSFVFQINLMKYVCDPSHSSLGVIYKKHILPSWDVANNVNAISCPEVKCV